MSDGGAWRGNIIDLLAAAIGCEVYGQGGFANASFKVDAGDYLGHGTAPEMFLGVGCTLGG